MVYNIHRSQINSYLQEHGISNEIARYEYLVLAYHSNQVSWEFNLLTFVMKFEPTEQVFIIHTSE